jgi:hypothetical protein
VDRFPQAERAKGFLLGWSAAARIDAPPSDLDPGDDDPSDDDPSDVE